MKLESIQTGVLGVNTYIITQADSAIVVDPACCAMCNDETLVEDYLTARNLKLEAILLTHGHFDHIMNLPFLKRLHPTVPIMIHEKDSELLDFSVGSKQWHFLQDMGLGDIAQGVKNMPKADILLRDKVMLQDFSEKPIFASWQVLHTPGHTMGSCCFYNEKEAVLLSGDTMFFHSYGRVDLGGNQKALMQSLAYIKDSLLQNTKVFPGHDVAGFLLKDNYF